jgi:prepilin-type N-terminal cleavage/methylation domain-containing protein
MLYGMQTVVTGRRAQRGFTLIELMIVLAIVSVVAAAVIPNVLRTIVKAQGQAQLGALKNGMMLARTRAIQSGSQAVVHFDMDSGPDGQDVMRSWLDTNPNEIWDAGEATLIVVTVDPRMNLTADASWVALASQPSDRGAVFQPNGTVILAGGSVGSANLVMTDTNANTVRLVMQAPAGTTRAQMLDPKTSAWDDALKHWRF